MAAYTIEQSGGLLEIRFFKEQDTDDLASLRAEIIALSKDQPCNILVDLSGVEGRMLPEGLDTFFKDLPFRRYAIFGGNSRAALRTKALLDSLPDHPNLKLFHLEEDARQWLVAGKE